MQTGGENAVKRPSVAIVILNWNGKHYLEKFLPSVIASTYSNKEIIIADNNSTDDSVVYIRNAFPEITILLNKENEGFAKGYNTALAQVEADYYVLLNSDIEVTPGWIEPVIQLMEADKSIAGCQPKILSWHNKTMFEYAGAAGGWIDNFGYPFSRGRIFEICEEDHGQYNDAVPCFWATGASLFIRAELYHKAGGLDPWFFAHQEEIDLCWRLHRMGYKIYVQPQSVIYHVGGGTLPKGNSRKTYLNFRNNLVMMHKNLPWSVKWWKIPLRMNLDALAALRNLIKGDSGFFVAILKAQFHYFGWIFCGPKPSKLPLLKEPEGWYKGSIVWQHFIKKKNKFSEIVDTK